MYTDEDKVFDIKYVRNATHLSYNNDISPNMDETFVDGSFKFHLGRIHCTFLYKLVVQLQVREKLSLYVIFVLISFPNLQRFIVNLEALPILEKLTSKLHQKLSTATETLKNNTKIILAINVSGPVFLIPQKSSSPNVMVIDTGIRTDGLYVASFIVELLQANFAWRTFSKITRRR